MKSNLLTLTRLFPSDAHGLTRVLALSASALLIVCPPGSFAQDNLDFGDAPDPTYPTLLANSGANHVISPLFLGATVDAEPDGQPSANADGDDINPPQSADDEDGVTFTSALISGVPSTVRVGCSGNGLLQAWVDFDLDGTWAPHEQIATDYPLMPGVNVVPFVPPPFTAPGTPTTTYARFRVSTMQGLPPDGPAPDGEVEDYAVTLYPLKWLQEPDATELGVDVDNTMMLADDFHCIQTGPITDIHIWGSFEGDFEGIDPVLLNTIVFRLSIWSDVPADPPQVPYSHPGQLLWDAVFTQGSYNAGQIAFVPPPGEWWHTPPNDFLPSGDFYCYQFDFYPDPTTAFSQVESNVYWLAVEVLDPPAGLRFGWKTTQNHFNDDAVWWNGDFWQELLYLPPHPFAELAYPENSMDLAFALSTEGEEELDWGDAPDPTYPTLAANGGANHTIVPNVFMGLLVDSEPDGQPTAAADGDDLNPAGGTDDEDGVTFLTPLMPGNPATAAVVSSQQGLLLNAWVDFAGDGSWAEAGDQIATNLVMAVAGTNLVTFNVPASAVPGTSTFARFRISTAPNLTFTGWAPNGEVEDHAVTIEEEPDRHDWGDAPDGAAAPGYPTLAINNGANHLIVPNVYLGTFIDAEPDGQPDPNALGDDSNPPAGNDDEDGVSFASLVAPGLTVTVKVTASTSGFLSAWLDFNRDGSWTGEQIFTDVSLAGGTTNLTFTVPASATPGVTFARFRFSTITGLGVGGAAPDGEVEDYEIRIEELDFGDAPDPTYPTLLASGGAYHVVTPMFLGALVDSEPDGQPNANATGDDINPPTGLDDEDGVVLPTALIAGVPNTIQVTASMPGLLQAWLDLNADGDWADVNEQVIANRALNPGLNAVTFSVPVSLTNTAVQTFMRFRFSGVQNLGYTGFAPDGEVEDYAVKLQPIKWLQRPELGSEGVDVDNASVPLADDFLCTKTGPITDIHLWGSFFHDVLPTGGPTNMTFQFTIWSDVPAGVDAPHSHPGTQLWTTTFTPGTFDAALCFKTSDGEWWHDPTFGANGWTFPGDTNIYQFDFYIDAADAFYQQEGTVYWLELKYLNLDGQEFTFGWKTTYDDWNDAACWFNAGSVVPWRPLVYSDGHPRAETVWTNLNFAFALSTSEEELPDWGDAPDPAYPTLAVNNGPNHIIGGPILGRLVDPETDGQPNATATGDDINPATADDEDGVTFNPPFITPGQTGSVTVVVSGAAGILNAWLDWARDGSWAEAGDQFFTNVSLAVGTHTLNFTAPTNTAWGTNLFTRWRISTISNLTYIGAAPDGEVEDHEVRSQDPPNHELGDAPDSSNNLGLGMIAYPKGGATGVTALYPTVYGSGMPNPVGPIHLQPWAIANLGAKVTGELEADTGPDQDLINNILPPLQSDNDGADDGLLLPLTLPHGKPSAVQFTVTWAAPGPPMVANMWFDWNRDGDWNDQLRCPNGVIADEWAVQNMPLPMPSGPYPTNVTYSASFPASWHPALNATSIWMRVTLAEQLWPAGGFTGAGGDGPVKGYLYGETEDYYLTSYETLDEYDFGDAPDPTYPTLLPNGARHYAIPGFSLGAQLDPETNGLPNLAATGDDLNGVDDEDGVKFVTPLVRGSNACVDVVLTGPLGGALDAWVDFNQDGVWGAAEQIFTSLTLVSGTNSSLCFAVPSGAALGTNYARFRLSSAGGLSPTGLAPDGEVEDYLVEICQRKLLTNVVITNIVVTNLASQQEVTLQWNAETGILYQMQETMTFSNTPPANWTNVGSAILGPSNTLVVTNSTVFERYYRVLVPFVCP